MSSEAEGSIRKCLVKKWADVSGYGFNLHADIGKAGHFIGKVDDESPAEASGLKDGDRIVEVNDVNIGNENHKQVVTRIKAGGDSVWLLVVDKDGDEYCKNNKVLINHDLPQVKTIECPDAPPVASAKDEDSNKDAPADETEAENDYETPADIPPHAATAPSESSQSDNEGDDEELPPPPPELTELIDVVNSGNDDPPEPAEPVETAEPAQEPKAEEEVEEPSAPAEEAAAVEAKIEEPAQPTEPPKPASQNGSPAQTSTPANEPVPKMSAAQMREALSKKKKPDPRKEQALSARDKLKMFQNL